MGAVRFRPDVKLVLEPGAAGRIVDEQRERSLALTPTEGRIVALLDAGSTAQSLTATAKAAGLDVDGAQVEALLTRLSAQGFVDYDGPAVSKLRDDELLPDDVVPGFRPDLKVSPGEKANLVQVSDPSTNRSFTLYDFEVHIARLLDGRHTVTEVIALAAKIGIPMTAQSLTKFVGQMKAYGFLSKGPAVPAPGEGGTWPTRAQWSPDVRELYQSALRLFRQGRPQHALEYLDVLLEIEPETPEALELKQRLLAHLSSGEETVEVSFEDLHGDGADALDELAAEPPPAVADSVLPDAQRAEADDDIEVDEAHADPVARAPTRKKRVLIAAAVGLCLAGLAFPVRGVSRAPCAVEPLVLGEPRSPAGIFGALVVTPGSHVDENAVVASLDTSKLIADKQALAAKIAALEKAPHPATAKPAVLKKARAALAKAEAELAKAKTKASKAKGAAMKRAQSEVAKKDAAVAKAKQALDALTGAVAQQERAAQLAAARDALAALKSQETASVVTSPSTGRFELSAPPSTGAVLPDGSTVGRIVDERFALLSCASAPPKGAIVVLGNQRLEMSALVQAAPGQWRVPVEAGRPSVATVEVPSGLRPWPLAKLQ